MINDPSGQIVDSVKIRHPGLAREHSLQNFSIDGVMAAFDDAWNRRVQCISLHKGSDEILRFLADKEVFHICLFVNDTDEYVYNNGGSDESRVEIAGDYWGGSEVCRDLQLAKSIAEHFYRTGELLGTETWIHRHLDW